MFETESVTVVDSVVVFETRSVSDVDGVLVFETGSVTDVEGVVVVLVVGGGGPDVAVVGIESVTDGDCHQVTSWWSEMDP